MATDTKTIILKDGTEYIVFTDFFRGTCGTSVKNYNKKIRNVNEINQFKGMTVNQAVEYIKMYDVSTKN